MVRQLYFETDGFGIYDITDAVKKEVKDVENGTVVVHVPHATAAIVALENEEGLVEDFLSLLGKLVPEGNYRHNRIDDNARAHLLAALLGPSLAIPIANGSLVLGTWQQVFLADLDEKPRQRRVILQVHKS